jgi:hypothetical protein
MGGQGNESGLPLYGRRECGWATTACEISTASATGPGAGSAPERSSSSPSSAAGVGQGHAGSVLAADHLRAHRPAGCTPLDRSFSSSLALGPRGRSPAVSFRASC